jgi:hypothetical protein
VLFVTVKTVIGDVVVCKLFEHDSHSLALCILTSLFVVRCRILSQMTAVIPEDVVSTSCEALYATNISYRKQKTFIYQYPLHLALLPTKKNVQQNAALR